MLNTLGLYTHNFFPYPAKFPPDSIREYLIRYSSEGETVLDPFCGSGTVLVEAMLNQRNAFGFELNPVSVLVSRAKSNIYTMDDITELDKVLEEISLIESDRNLWLKTTLTEPDIPNYKNRDLWFKENMLLELAALKKVFLKNQKRNKSLQELVWMAFLKIIVNVSNQDTDTRYASVNKIELVDGFAILKFKETIEEYKQKLSNNILHFDKNPNVTVVEGDVNKKLKDSLPDESIDLVITSPPYINTFDYYLYHKHRIFWMDRDPQEIRRQEIGCHHRIDAMVADKAINEYYTSMDNLFKNLYLKLKHGSHFVILIGDGIVKGNLVNADQLVIELAAKNNFTVEEINTTGLRDVSKGFIKGRNLDKKRHHSIVLKRW